MKIKKRLKYKSTLPKADYGMDPNALSNMNKQAVDDASPQGGGIGTAGAMNMATQGLNFVSAFTPQDNNDGIGMSHKASKITSGISTGLDTASQMAGSFSPIAGAAIGGVSALFKKIKGAVDYKRENDRSITSRLARKEYDPTQDNVGYSFGNGTAKYGMPLFGDGGSMKYNTEPIYTSNPKDKRLQSYNDSLDVYTNAIKNWKEFARLTNNVNNPRFPSFENSIFYKKKPVQPVIYRKETKVPVPKKNFSLLNDKQDIDILGDNIQYQNEPTQESTTQEIPQKGGFPQGTFKTKSPYGGPHEYDSKGRQLYKNGGEPTMKQYQDFNNFRKATNPEYLGKDYDLQSAFQELPFKTMYDWQQDPEKNHLPDTYKLPNHPTFSTESKYYKPGMPAGYWKGDTYVPINRPTSAVTTNPNLVGIDDPNKQKAVINKELERNNGVRPGYALGGDPREQSNIEAEQGEAMQHSSGTIENIEGQKHENGGTPLQVQPSHEYIYSDSLGYDREGNMTLDENLVKTSFADGAKKIERKYKGRDNDLTVMTTKKLELGKLKQDAEQARVAKEEIEMGKQMKKYKAKYGANLKKFGTSGYVPFTNFPGSIGDEAVDPNSTLAMQQQLLQYNPNALPKYGADNKWGAETTAGFANNPGVYNLQQPIQSSTPQPLFGGGNRINPFVGPRIPSRRDNLREAANFYTPGQIGTAKPMGTAQDRQTDIAPEITNTNKKSTGFFGDLTTGDKMQLASMLPAFGFNMGMGLRKADVEPNRKNPYENDVLSMMANRKFDIQNYLNQSNLATNTAKEDIGNNSTSVGGKMANLQKLFANQSNALGDITTKGQEMNNQYRAEEANTKNILGEANRAELIRAAGINDQNKARKQQFIAKAMEQMGQGLATTGQAANQSLTNKILAKSLSEIAPDFDIKELKDVYRDKDGYIIFRGEKTNIQVDRNGTMVNLGTTTADPKKSQYAPKSFSIGNFTNINKSKSK